VTSGEEVGTFRAPDGVALRYTRRRSGSPRVVIVSPGIFMHRDGDEHRLLAERLLAVADVVTLDVRGHGDSGGAFTFGVREPEDLAAFAASLRGEYQAVGGLGFSFGGFHTLVAAARHRVFDAVATVAAPHRLFILDHNFLTPALLRGLTYTLRRRRRPTRLSIAPGGMPPVPSRLVGSIAPVPLLVAHGASDWLIAPSHARRLFEAAGEPRELLLLEKGLHAENILADDPEPLVRALLDFFSRRLPVVTSSDRRNDADS
jgi:pimeloyl-ACP methyl ester carboxylesterase